LSHIRPRPGCLTTQKFAGIKQPLNERTNPILSYRQCCRLLHTYEEIIRIEVRVTCGLERAHPDANIRVLAQRPIRHLQRDAEDVLVDEEVAARKLEPVQEAHQIEEKGITAQASIESVRAISGDSDRSVEIHRRAFDDGFAFT
jgi:hypothetical protein